MSPEIQKIIDKAEADAKQAVQEWVKKTNIKETVERMLNDKLREIVLQLLGFEKRYGEFQVDHGNGRSGESAAGDWLRKQAGETINAWLTEQAGNLPKLNAKTIKSIKDSYEDQLYYTAKDVLRQRVTEDADAIVKKVCGEE